MALPKQIEQQMREIEELEKQLNAQSEPPAEPTAEPEPKSEQQAEPDKTVPVEPTAEVKPNEPTTPEVTEETWQQKYRTLKGMYDAEVPRLHAQVKELQTYVANLRQQAEAKPAPSATPTTSTKRESLVTDEDVQAFGADLIEVQRKVAREVAMEFGASVDALKAENEELRSQIQRTGSQVGEMTFEQKLHRMVPDFDNLNNDPTWVSWLDEFDPILRSPRRAIAQSAFNSGDAEGVAYYVNLFRQLTAVPVANPKDSELERQVQPTRSATSQTPVSQKGKIYSTNDVEKMFQKITQLHSTQKFDEAKKLEAEIDAAYMDGRVTA